MTFLAILIAVVVWALVRRPWFARWQSDEARLGLTLAFAALTLVGPLVAIAARNGAELVALDRADQRRASRFAPLAQHLESAAHRDAQASGKRGVLVLGDSTHFWPDHEGERELGRALAQALPSPLRESVHVYGVAFGAATAYDYLLLLERLADQDPALVVLPVNLRSFSRWYQERAAPDHRRAEAWIPWRELPRLHGLAVGRREIRWDRVALARLDARLFDGDGSPFLHGLERTARRRLDRALEAVVPERWRRPLDAAQQRATDPGIERWPSRIDPDNALVPVFRAINALAERRGMQILYYTVQANETEQRRRGNPLRQREHYAAIEDLIGGAPHVHFLDLVAEAGAPEWMFADEGDHLSARGLADVVERLAHRIPGIVGEPSR